MTESCMQKHKENQREIVLDILLEVLEKKHFSHIVIRMALDKFNYLPDSEKAFISRLAKGCIERTPELDYIIDSVSRVKTEKMKPVIRNILRMTVYQLKYMNTPVHAACNEAVKLASKRGFSSLKGFVNGVARNIARNLDSISLSESPQIKYCVPAWLYESLLKWYPEDTAERYLDAVLNKGDSRIYVHYNNTELSSEEITAMLIKEGASVSKAPYADDCYQIEVSGSVAALEAFKMGYIQIQDISSAMAAQCVAPEKNSFCIDTCSAPGGKSIHLAAAMAGTGKVLCRDVSEEKLYLIQENIDRSRLKNIEVQLFDGCCEDEHNRGKADYVLVDAPCSGLGILARKPDIKYHLTPSRLEDIVKLQRRILAASAQLVKPGGILVYSTCTVNPHENKENIEWFMSEFPFELQELSGIIKKPVENNELSSGMLQLIPGINRCDGFFIARLKKKSD